MLVAKITGAINAREEWTRSQCMMPKVNMTFRDYMHLLESFGKGLPPQHTISMHMAGPNETQMFMPLKANEELHRYDQILDLDFVGASVDEGDRALQELEQALAGPPRR